MKEDWYNFLEVYPNEKPSFLVFADPFAFDGNGFLAGIKLGLSGNAYCGRLGLCRFQARGKYIDIGWGSHEGRAYRCLSDR